MPWILISASGIGTFDALRESRTKFKRTGVHVDTGSVTVKYWHLGVVAVAALLVIALFVGYSLAPKQLVGGDSASVQQLAQKDQEIAKLRLENEALRQINAAAGVIAASAQDAFSDRVDKSAVQADIRAVLPDIESYDADNVPSATYDPDAPGAPGVVAADASSTDSGYTGITVAILKAAYDQAFPANLSVNTTDTVGVGVLGRVTATATNYCAVSTTGRWYAWKLGPAGVLSVTTDPAAVCQR